MNRDTHVYCTDCKYGEELLNEIAKDENTKLPKHCIGCYPYDPEDSTKLEKRPNYEQL